MYPSSIAAYGLPDLADQDARRQGQGGRVDASDDDVRVQQAVLRAARAPTTRGTTSSWRRSAASGRVDFRSRPVPRPDLGGHHAVRRHLRLRAGDDSRGGEGRAVRCFVRPDTRIPFMAMPDGVDALLTLAAAPRERADADRLQRRRVQPVGRGDAATSSLEAFPDAADRLGRGRQAPGHRRLLAGRRRRQRRAARLGLRPRATTSNARSPTT